MPSFRGLAEQVYERLGEQHDNEPAERRAFLREEFDRALRSLEKRTHLPKTDSRVRAVVAEILTGTDGVDLSDHLALLQLSRDPDGRPRLLTTNFDTLFERAAEAAQLDVLSHAGKSIPRPGGPTDCGILHLHGRIADGRLGGIESTELILTSADFGDAYLRDGWASQYIEDRMRQNPVVLVGYGAEDPALRLLLETLDADRERFPDLKPVYAVDKRTDDSASIWNAKGIKPIEFDDYPGIYATLREWARYAVDPAGYERARMSQILAVAPRGGQP
jgi:SIR2-like domain